MERPDPEALLQNFIADAAIYGRIEDGERIVAQSGIAVLSEPSIKPKICTIPYPEEHRETFVTIRRGSSSEVVTVIELLSPTNKRKGTDGREQYLDKIQALLKTKLSLVELDLLRGGERSMVLNPPEGDYFAMVSKPKPRPLVEVYGWKLAHRLPTIHIPLSVEDPDVSLALQAIFDVVYDRAGYDYSLDYRQAIVPALSESDSFMVKQVIAGRPAV